MFRIQMGVIPAYKKRIKSRALKTYVRHWLMHFLSSAEVHIDFVTLAEMTKLNKKYRDKKGPTNVLSFSGALPLPGEQKFLGNVIICPEVVACEAQEQGKTFDAHLAHLLLHGCLHLLGFDHLKKKEAKVMEALEVKLLDELGFEDPYNDSAR